jgi:gliding motility-associated protein GldM
MSGATNCPETPRQKMIGMMYLVLTAMLALNVSADILNGFLMVDNSLINNINTGLTQKNALYDDMQYLYEQNPAKVGEWLEKANLTKQKSDSLIAFIHQAKADLMMTADKVEIAPDTVNRHKLTTKDNTDIASNYFIGGDEVNGSEKGQQFKRMLEEYRHFVEQMFGDDSTSHKIYEQRFSTEPAMNSHGTELVPWLNAQFESMPIIAVTTQLSKYENDVQTTEQELLSYFKSQTDAGDFRVNKIEAFVIPASKHVMQGGQYKAQIVLSAVDSTKVPEYYIGSNKLSSGTYTASCNSVGTFPFSGKIVLKGNDGVPREYPFKDEYTVGEPSATIANEDMNVVYKGFNNRLRISVPGVSDSKVRVDVTGATLTKSGSIYICKPTSNADVKINVSADVDGKFVSMGSTSFRVKALPDPAPFLQYTDDNNNVVLYNPNIDGYKKAPNKKQLLASKFVAQYADGLLKANFKIADFEMVATVRGGNTTKGSPNNEFSADQLNLIKALKPGQEIFFKNIRCTGDKTTILSYPPIAIPAK